MSVCVRLEREDGRDEGGAVAGVCVVASACVRECVRRCVCVRAATVRAMNRVAGTGRGLGAAAETSCRVVAAAGASRRCCYTVTVYVVATNAVERTARTRTNATRLTLQGTRARTARSVAGRNPYTHETTAAAARCHSAAPPNQQTSRWDDKTTSMKLRCFAATTSLLITVIIFISVYLSFWKRPQYGLYDDSLDGSIISSDMHFFLIANVAFIRIPRTHTLRTGLYWCTRYTNDGVRVYVSYFEMAGNWIPFTADYRKT